MKIASVYGPTRTISRKVDKETASTCSLGEPPLEYVGKKYLGKVEVKKISELCSENFRENHFTQPPTEGINLRPNKFIFYRYN